MVYSDDYDRYGDELPPRRMRDDYRDDFNDVSRRRLHSRFGIASFILALIVGLYEFIMIVIAGYLSIKAGGELDEESPEAIVLGIFILGGLALNVVSLCLAIAGLCESGRAKVFAVLGLVLSLVAFLGVCGLMAIGIATG